jgi:hypothetical protein
VQKRFEVTSEWNSHLPLIYLAADIQVDKWYEFGCGLGSTLAIDRICADYRIPFSSFETNREWFKKVPSNNILLQNDYNDIILKVENCMILIDSAPAETRVKLIQKYKDLCKAMIVHDTEEGAEYVYGMGRTLESFKHRAKLRSKKGYPETDIVSNTISFDKWKGEEYSHSFIEIIK